ncbi:MAG: CBS domain-containing protein [Methanobacteriaceae archaeon]|nr:CBS domain-containing protein [Methanobacteriaceae archaeon]
MLTAVQKEILQSLINLYKKSNGASIKGDQIAKAMERNSGTIRNQMQSLRGMGLVNGVPGPCGGYKPTIDAYHLLNISDNDEDIVVPLTVKNKDVNDISVSKVEFTSILHPGECEAIITVLGDIKQLELGDTIRVGPTPVNNLIIDGVIVGRDDIDGIILLETLSIYSIPKKRIKDVATQNIIILELNVTIREAAKILSNNKIKGAPVVGDKKEGILTLTDITRALSENNEDSLVSDYCHKDLIKVDENIRLAEAIKVMQKNKVGRLILINENKELSGIITQSDILKQVAGLK